MVSFSCEGCGDILTKKKLDPHANRCYGASFTCIDCMVHFQGTEYRAHTSCMTEAQKYQGHLYRGEKQKGKGPKPRGQEQALVPHQAPVEAGPVAVVNVPPKAPSPPPAPGALPPGVNVFDFLVKDAPANAKGDSKSIVEKGYSYGTGPVEPPVERYDSYTALPGVTKIVEPSPSSYLTPGPKREREEKKSDKKRKRENLDLDTTRARSVQDQDMSDAPPGFHTGLTGGLNRMLSGPDFGGDEAPTPLNPDKKRSKKEKADKHDEKKKSASGTTKVTTTKKHHRRGSSSSEDDRRGSRKQVKAIDYRTVSVEPRSDNQVVTYSSPAELFLSFVNKGPDSERGLSINKALKRFHREQEIRGDKEDDKDLWKGLRVRKNERGEFILFV